MDGNLETKTGQWTDTKEDLGGHEEGSQHLPFIKNSLAPSGPAH